MGWTQKRKTKNGGIRYRASYRDLRGQIQTAGTFSSERAADRAWQKAETRLAEGRLGDPRRGRQTFRRYVTEEWLPNHVIEVTTRESYTYQLNKHIMPWFGSMRMNEIMASTVREWITDLRAKKVSPATIQKVRFILSAIFTAALNDVTYLHPCKGVKTPTVPKKPLKIITPEQFDAIYAAIPGSVLKLLVETDIEAGLRWGELTELRVKDFESLTRVLTISRTVVQVDPKFHPTGERFLVKQYPKDKEFRRVKISPQLSEKVDTHIKDGGLGPDDLIFAMPAQDSPTTRLRAVPDLTALGLTKPNAAAIYRAQRRAAGKDSPRRPRMVDTDGHIPRDWFRLKVWKPALKQAGITFSVRAHDLRHAHASWLLAGGADLQMVKDRLGHGSISTTEKYLHTLPEADDIALDAFAKIRNRAHGKTA